MKISLTTLGSDPEFFVLDPKNKPYPATNFAEGTKENPKNIKQLGSGFFEQRDNVSFEGNIPPCYNKEAFVKNMLLLRNYFSEKVGKFGYSLSDNGVEYFDKRFLALPEAQEFGCSSVISAWDSSKTYSSKRPTPNLSRYKFRVSGFHIHIGYELLTNRFSTSEMKLLVVRLFDLFLSLPSQIIKPEPERIQTYGHWGMFRDKPYGVECRTLSSYFSTEKYLPWVWDQIVKIETFINTAKEQDLKILVQYPHIVGNTNTGLEDVFRFLFGKFSSRDCLNSFEEIKRFV